MSEVQVVSTRMVNDRDTEIILSNGVRILTNDGFNPVVQITAANDRAVDIVTIEEGMSLIEMEMNWI